MPTIHPTALVDSAAQIADTAVVGPYCVIGPEVVVGAHTELHNHVTVQALTTIGERGKPLLGFFESLNDAMMKLTDWIIRLTDLMKCTLAAKLRHTRAVGGWQGRGSKPGVRTG